MAHLIQTPSTSSLPADLRPAPLRIPLRKSVADLHENSRTAPTKAAIRATDTLTTSTSYPGDIGRLYQSAIPGTRSKRRDPRSKFESLISRFEIIDAVKSVDSSVPQYPNSSYNTRPSTIPRATESKRIPQQDLIVHSPTESISPTSSELSSYQSRTPEVGGPRSPLATSAIPVLRHSKPAITSKEAPPSRLPKPKSFRKNNTSFLQLSSASATSLNAATRPGPKTVTPPRQETPETSRKESKLPAGSRIQLPQQRLSVADLRQSFEKISQPAKTSGETARPSLNLKPSLRSLRPGEDMPISISQLRPELLKQRFSVAKDRSSCSQPPIFGKGHIVNVRPRSKASGLPSPKYAVAGSVRHESSPSLSRTERSSVNETRQKERNITHQPGKQSLPQNEREKLREEPETDISFQALMDSLDSDQFGEKQGDGTFEEATKPKCELSAAEDSSVKGQSEVLGVSTASPPDSRPTQGVGKVSQLRKFFERSSKILSSPLSIMNSRPTLEQNDSNSALMGSYPSSSCGGSESPRSMRTLARRISIVPSLTTEISVNDFFCDFVGHPSCEESPVTASPSETAVKVGSVSKHESPVKSRIQQFEHLSRDSLKAAAAIQQHDKHNHGGPPSSFEKDNRRGGKRGSWRPIHKKGVAIWRKISNSLSYSFDSWKDCNSYHEQINVVEDTGLNTSSDHSTSTPDDLKHGVRHFSPFGYSMHRVTHMSRQFVTPSHTTSSIPLTDRDTTSIAPRRALNTSYDRSSPDTPPPPLIIRKSLPIIARVTSGLHRPNGFGLDGHFPSKPVPEEEFRPADAPTSGPSTPQGDPDALLKVMLKQSAAERSRRREDEKHLRRDKKLRALAIWKGKGKADAATPLPLTDEVGPSGEASRKHDRGKWKGKGKEKEVEPKENDGHSSKGQENETNKKTESGFEVFESKDVKLRHPKPRRPGQVRKVANMYKEKGSSGASINTKASSGATLKGKEKEKEGRQSFFRQKASSALGLRRRDDGPAG
ncbi:hypothetical protein F5Y03DRAFT_387856 [Xylaria venustula]|nr:hypothetical protein F5Y03DRAFT_387856 [Xylaria venustula]